jgi:hypothetical protein
MSVEPLPTMHPAGEIRVSAGHPFAPDSLAVSRPGSNFADYGVLWDNSARNGHCAPISWSNRLRAPMVPGS